jgi:hypothetical protein
VLRTVTAEPKSSTGKAWRTPRIANSQRLESLAVLVPGDGLGKRRAIVPLIQPPQGETDRG